MIHTTNLDLELTGKQLPLSFQDSSGEGKTMIDQEQAEKHMELALAPVMEALGIKRVVSRGIKMGWSERQGTIIAAIKQMQDTIKRLEIAYKQVKSEKEEVIQLTLNLSKGFEDGLQSLTKEVSSLIIEKNKE